MQEPKRSRSQQSGQGAGVSDQRREPADSHGRGPPPSGENRGKGRSAVTDTGAHGDQGKGGKRGKLNRGNKLSGQKEDKKQRGAQKQP